MAALQAAVDPLDGVTFVLGDDALLNVGVDLLVHEVLQLGQVIIWRGRHNKRWGHNQRGRPGGCVGWQDRSGIKLLKHCLLKTAHPNKP